MAITPTFPHIFPFPAIIQKYIVARIQNKGAEEDFYWLLEFKQWREST